MQDHGTTKVPAKETVRKLRRFLYSESPPIVLATARLIAMLLSAQDVSLQQGTEGQCTSKVKSPKEKRYEGGNIAIYSVV